MCGIFGVIGASEVPRMFGVLGERNTERGNRAFGALVLRGEARATHRFAGPFDASRVPLDGAEAVFGHVRAPTHGDPDNLAEVHPFETRAVLLAHNGLLLNHDRYPQWRIDTSSEVDSQVIAGGVQSHLDAGLSIVEAICRTIEVLDGQQACWLWHKPSAQLYLWRVMSPIYTGIDASNESLCFSSIKSPGVETLLAEGMLHRLDTDARAFRPLQAFSYYSPYRISKG